MMIDVVYHPDCALHNPPFEVTNGKVQPYGGFSPLISKAIETPARYMSIKTSLESQPESFRMISAAATTTTTAAGGGPSATDDDDEVLEPLLLAVHDADFIEFLKTIHADWTRAGQTGPAVAETFAHHGIGMVAKDKKQDPHLHVRGKLGLYNFDLSIAYTQDTYRSVHAAAQVAITAAKRIVEDGQKAVYALCRPPGHHAACNVAGGYCFLNNAAVAAKYLRNASTLSKVLILDLDFHHGNGTQDIFYDDPSVFYVSLHAHPGYYPYFTGSHEETGSGPGLGLTMNVPLDPKTTTDASYLETLADVLSSPKLAGFQPDYIVVSLGVDTWHQDPAGGMQIVDKATYNAIGQTIRKYSKGTTPVVFVQEGGLCIEVLGELVGRVLCGFAAGSN